MAKKEFAQLAHSFGQEVTPESFERVRGWWASRKLNGWGCLWDGGVTRGIPAYKVPWYYLGGDSRLKSYPVSTGLWTIGRSDKYGIRPKTIQAPDWFLDLLPKGVPLQGEIWCDDNLQAVKSICGGSTAEKKSSSEWEKVKFAVYNLKPYCLWFEEARPTEPHHNYTVADSIVAEGGGYKVNLFWNNNSLADRLTLASRKVSTPLLCDLNCGDNVYEEVKETVFILPQLRLATLDSLYRCIATVKAKGWEGVMLANPDAPYECARSHNLLKIKPEFDAEAEVIGYEDGSTGKNIGKMGAVICRMTWGEEVNSVTGGRANMIGQTVQFKVSGWSDAEREWSWIKANYPIGSQLQFTYSCVSVHGVPCSCNRVGAR